jgi:murein tripeptide amidase MpaA
MWNELQVRISDRQLQPRTIQEFGTLLVQEWTSIPVRTTRNLIGSMKKSAAKLSLIVTGQTHGNNSKTVKKTTKNNNTKTI